MEEVWKSVVGYEGEYSVSNIGRARRDKVGKNEQARIVSGAYNQDKYIQISLCRNAKRKLRMLHRLVAEAFIGNIPEGYEVNHLDGNKENNALSNLQIVTPYENNLHARMTGLWKPLTGEKVGHSKLNYLSVTKIRKLYAQGGRTYVDLAKEFGVKKTAIYKVIKKQSWNNP